ncbi:MAG: aldo/keto reductase [candidate division KSB1 bacterium]|nr:aldo/keto reductase [candidate division KSB1 bacterium]MDZ7302564.1 aldo/keto reductase [candidate division KSB1 bacterium]MDZ7310670.1 aldo/keto reductase [candidate division KSB1 bacterium]
MQRREFIKYTAVTASALTFSPFINLSTAEIKKKYANDMVTLGKTGIKASRLAMGTGTNGINRHSRQTERLGLRGLAELLRAAYDQGINFWDSADQYGTHPHLKEALKSLPREKVVILTKTNATTAAEMKADLDRFREEIGTAYLDIVLLHCMTDSQWPVRKRGAMEVLAKAREDGIIRAHGVSCHTLGALEAAANSDWVQVNLARINPAGVQMDAEVPTVVKLLQKMHKDGKGVIGMKIFGGGGLRYQVDECLQYILNLDFVDAFTIGQESQKEMQDLVKRIPAASIKA